MRIKSYCLIFIAISFSNCITPKMKEWSDAEKFVRYKSIKEVKIKVDDILNNNLTDIDSIIFPKNNKCIIISNKEDEKFIYYFILKEKLLYIFSNIYKGFEIVSISYFDEIGKITQKKLNKALRTVSMFDIVVTLKKESIESYIKFHVINDIWYIDTFYYYNFEEIKKFM